MRLIKFTAIAAFTLVQAGCVYSVHPILKQSDLAATYNLSGTWERVSDDPRQAGGGFTAEGYANGLASEYFVAFAGKEFEAQVGRIGDEHYIQFRQDDLAPEAPPLLTALPVYGFAKIKVVDDKLHLFKVDEGLAVALFEKNHVPFVKYEPSQPIEFYVLTGNTEAVQELIKKSGDQIFTKEPITFVRTSKRDGQPHESERTDQR